MTLLAPIALLGLISLPLLVVFYLFRPDPRRQGSTTYFLWRAAAPDSQGGTFANRLQSNPLLWLQLLVLLAIVLFLARPSVPWTSRVPEASKVVIVIDRSASMQAGGAFEKARERAREAVDSLLGFRLAGSTPEVMLLAVDSEPQVLVPFTKDPSRLQQAINTLEPTDKPDRLESLRPLLLSMVKSHKAKIWLFGDRLPEELHLGGLQFTSLANGANDNTGIMNFSVRSPDPSRGLNKPFLYTRIENFSANAQQRTVRLEKMASNDPSRVEALVLEKNLLLPANSGQTLVEALSAARFETDKSSVFRLTLSPVPGAQADLFPVDDEAFSVVSSFRSERVLVAVAEGAKSSFLLRAIAASQGIKVVPLKEVLAQSPAPTVDLLLLPGNMRIPGGLEARTVFTLAPEPDSQEGKVSRLRPGDTRAPLVADSGIEWTRLKVQITDNSKVETDESVLLDTDQGPALTLSGVSGGQPTLHWRFPLAYSSLPLSPALPVLVGRFIDRYSRSAAAPTSGSFSTESVMLRPNGEAWSGPLKLDPLAGPASQWGSGTETPEDSKVIRPPDHTGLYSLNSQSAAEPLAVGLYSYQESSLKRTTADAAFASEEAEKVETPSPEGEETLVYRGFGIPFLVLALLLLLAEAALFLKRGRP